MSSSEEVINAADILLREVPNVKIGTNSKPAPFKPKAKEEMQFLIMSKESQDLVMQTLKYIHGEDFVLQDISAYEDKGDALLNKYWQNRGNLIIKGCCDYSNTQREPENEMERLKMFALLRLESYGFHKEHCQEALDYCDGKLEDSLQLLYEKYFRLTPTPPPEHNYSENELLEQRTDEKSVLESIYETSFHEKVQNSVWIIKCKLGFLVNLFHKKNDKKKENIKPNTEKKKAKCRNFLQGQVCKFGDKCRFSHEEEAKPDINGHLDNFTFELEFRFPTNTKYPYEPPLIFLKTDAVLPDMMPLHICKRLHEEATSLALVGMPSVYSIIEFLNNEEEILNYINSTRIHFLSPDEKLFPKVLKFDSSRANRPTHYKKGVTGRDNQHSLSLKEKMALDKKIAFKFREKQGDATYRKMQISRAELPAWSFRTKVLEAVGSHQIVIISGETGCGKSTQIPQYILDEWLDNYDHNSHAEIVCTQPRRISAIGVAERVAQERAEKVGNTVGYQIRLESKMSSNTRLTFCTTGILLRRLEIDPELRNVTHIIVDEVHERSEESDFLLVILKDLLKIRTDLKVILMSATLNEKVFSDYFGDVPVLQIPGRTFPVQQIFLEEILDLSDYVFDFGSQYARPMSAQNLEQELASGEVRCANVKPRNTIKDEVLKLPELLARYNDCSLKTCQNLYVMDPMKINLDLIEHVLSWIVFGEHEHPREGSILIFLPGIAEITALHEQLSCHPVFSPKYRNFILIPLHSNLTSAEQALVFEKPKESHVRKIVLTTNIAETSITIDDCVYVIDSGKMKEKHFDSNRNMESLDTVWVTRANALQRKGRAGRVRNGVCVHLYTSNRFEHQFLSQPIPEIQRIPLEQLILNIKVLPNFANCDVHDVLGRTIEPPVTDSIDSSLNRLHNVGALDGENNLTPLGHHLAMLPVDVRIGKLMLFGAIFSCLDSALTIAACLSNKSPFVAPFGKKDLAQAKKQKFAKGLSDQLTILEAYNKFQEANKKSYMAGQNFARENYLSHNTLLTISDIKYQFLELLVGIGFVPVDLKSKPRSGQDNVLSITGVEFNKYSSNVNVLSSILCAALYPNIAKIFTPEKQFIQSAAGAVPKQSTAKDFKFHTKQEQVFMHPSSILFETKRFPSLFMVFQEKVKTSKIFIRDCSVIPLISMVLFSGFDVNINVHNGRTFIVLDDKWIMFEVDKHNVAEMIKMMRVELLDILEAKIKEPLLNIQNHDTGSKVINTILHLVTHG